MNIRVKAQQIWEELEWTPQEEIGKALAEGDVCKFVFSVENMARAQQFYQEVHTYNCTSSLCLLFKVRFFSLRHLPALSRRRPLG